jgi:hypothetical protein
MKRIIARLGVVCAALGIVLGTAGSVAASAAQAAPASVSVSASAVQPAPVAAHRSTCAARTVCFFNGLYETGTKWPIDISGCPGSGLCGTWYSIPGKGSIINNTNSSVKVWSDLMHSGHCVLPQNTENLNNTYGYFYVKYASANCSGIPNHN